MVWETNIYHLTQQKRIYKLWSAHLIKYYLKVKGSNYIIIHVYIHVYVYKCAYTHTHNIFCQVKQVNVSISYYTCIWHIEENISIIMKLYIFHETISGTTLTKTFVVAQNLKLKYTQHTLHIFIHIYLHLLWLFSICLKEN